MGQGLAKAKHRALSMGIEYRHNQLNSPHKQIEKREPFESTVQYIQYTGMGNVIATAPVTVFAHIPPFT